MNFDVIHRAYVFLCINTQAKHMVIEIMIAAGGNSNENEFMPCDNHHKRGIYSLNSTSEDEQNTKTGAIENYMNIEYNIT